MLSGLIFTLVFAHDPGMTILRSCGPASPHTSASESKGPGPGRWTSWGGSPSHAGRVTGEGLRGPLREAWRMECKGPIEGEPLVWDDRILIVLDLGRGRHQLTSLSLLEGNEQSKISVNHEGRMEPSVWGSTIVVATDKSLSTYRWTNKKITKSRTKIEGEGLMPPLIRGDEVYVGGEFGLERRQLESGKTDWTLEGLFVGGLALHGNRIYALRQRSMRGTLLGIDALNGRVVEEFELTQMPSDAEALRISACSKVVWLGGGNDIVLANFESVPRGPSLNLPRPLPAGRITGWATHMMCAPADHANGGFLTYMRRDDETMLMLTHDQEQYRSLAKKETGAPFFEEPFLSPTIVGSVAYVGSGAFDLRSNRVYWKGDQKPSIRPVAATRTVLYVQGDRTLIAMRETSADPMPYHASDLGAEAFTGQALLADGKLDSGEFQLAEQQDSITKLSRRGKHDELPKSLVRLLETDAGRLVWTGDVRVLGATMMAAASAELGAAYVELTDDARSSNDLGLIQRLARVAQDLGSTDPKLEKAADTVQKLRERPKNAKSKAVAKLLKQEQALPSLADALWKRFEGLENAPLALRIEALDALLAHDPGEARALASVRAILPDGLRVEGEFDGRDWLEFMRAAERTPIEIVPKPESEVGATEDQRFFGRALNMKWRDDLIALRSENLLIISSAARPGAIARCLSHGELVCSALAEVFAAGEHVRDQRYPLSLFLYSTKDEYLQQSKHPGSEAGSGLSWTAGHFSPGENVSRIFVPDGDEEIESVMETYAHELTHHWLQVKCPMYTQKQLMQRRKLPPSYWIVEGFASLVEEFQFDTAVGGWDSFNRRAARLDSVAGADEEQLVPWKSLFTLDQQEFRDLNREGEFEIRLGWRLGYRYRMSETSLFYSQAASACQYLYHAEDGKHRAALLQYAAAYYTSNPDGLDVQKAFGMTAQVLGENVKEYAEAVARGERP
ncbi:MAG: hypothetical protein ACI841_000290 [Planctomycetota bacterium]|jgi:hypothetical protein